MSPVNGFSDICRSAARMRLWSFGGIRLSSFCARFATWRFQLIGELFQSYKLPALDFSAAAPNTTKFRDGWRFFRKAAKPEVSAQSFAHEVRGSAAFLANHVLDLFGHSRRKVKNLDDVFGGAHTVHSLAREKLIMGVLPACRSSI